MADPRCPPPGASRVGAPLLLILTTLLLLPPVSLEGQRRVRGPIVLELPASARALALGGLLPVFRGGAEAIFVQPGVLDRPEGFSASVLRYGSAATVAAASAGGSWFGGGVAVGVRALSYEASAEYPLDAHDILDLPEDPSTLRRQGSVGVTETVIGVGYGRRMGGLRMGLSGKLIEQRFGPLHAATAAVDLGAAFSPGPLTVALAARNLGRGLRVSGKEIPLPVRYGLTASTETVPVGPLDLSASAGFSYREGLDPIPSFGLEVAYWPVTGRTFVGRVGCRRLPQGWEGQAITWGAAFLGDNLVLDYAWEGFESGRPAHWFSVGWR